MDTTPLTQLITDLRAIPDRTERAQAAGALLTALADAQREATEVRRADVAEMRKTLKVREVAEALGVSLGRVDQIARAKPRT